MEHKRGKEVSDEHHAKRETGKPDLRQRRPESRERLRELMLFIAERCLNDPTFGAVKLNRILLGPSGSALRLLCSGVPLFATSYDRAAGGCRAATRLRCRRTAPEMTLPARTD